MIAWHTLFLIFVHIVCVTCFIFLPQVIAFSESRVTTVMAVGEELWVGLGNGQVLIFDVFKNSAYEDDAYVVLKESKGKPLYSIQISVFSVYFQGFLVGWRWGLSL